MAKQPWKQNVEQRSLVIGPKWRNFVLCGNFTKNTQQSCLVAMYLNLLDPSSLQYHAQSSTNYPHSLGWSLTCTCPLATNSPFATYSFAPTNSNDQGRIVANPLEIHTLYGKVSLSLSVEELASILRGVDNGLRSSNQSQAKTYLKPRGTCKKHRKEITKLELM